MTQFMRLAYASFLLFAVTALIAPLQANAQDRTPATFGGTALTPALRVEVPGAPTKYMTVYFARGRAPLIATEGKQVLLSEIKAKIRVQLSGDTVEIPAREVTKRGVFAAYNYLVLVFHNQEQFTWLNADDSLPENESAQGQASARKVIVLDALDINKLPLDQKGQKRIRVDGF